VGFEKEKKMFLICQNKGYIFWKVNDVVRDMRGIDSFPQREL